MRSVVKKTNQKVLVAMSGGVDSSVSAALLVAAGYDVTGAFMINYDSGRAPVGDANCWLPEYRDALRVAAALGIPLLKLDFTKQYQRMVLDYMFAEYRRGRTPNPDVLCNTFIKFGVWLAWARKHGFDKLATGHYARLKVQSTEYRVQSTMLSTLYSVLSAIDENKDQTYFLHQLNQEQLSHVLFPIGEYTKPQVRSLARRFGLPTAEKAESMGICFVGEVPMKKFLSQKIKPKPGKIVTTAGTVIGKHDGLPFYTIGQRHFGVTLTPSSPPPAMGRTLNYEGKNSSRNFSLHQSTIPPIRGEFEGGLTQPLYIVAKNFKKNELIVGHEDDPLLYKKEITIANVHWVAGLPPQFPLHCYVRLRHRQALQRCSVEVTSEKKQGTIVLRFDKQQRAVTPGQFAVFYLKGGCLGGGVIQ